MNVEMTRQMAQLAKSFCSLVERFDDCQLDAWLEEMADLLPRLHTAMSDLGQSESINVYEQSTDYDARFDLFTRLFSVLGERNGYNYEYDGVDGQRLSGTLADDITDIYFDLKQGLQVLEENPQQAARDWQHSYEFHWRHHLVDAERQLGQIESQVSH